MSSDELHGLARWRQRFLAPAAFKGPDERWRVAAHLTGDIGVFVEVGANEPVVGSQTYELECKGWRGILVEPLRECAERLRSARAAKVYQVAAGAPEDSGKELPLLVSGGLSTLKSNIKMGVEASEQRLVPIKTLDSILQETGIERIRLSLNRRRGRRARSPQGSFAGPLSAAPYPARG